MKPSRANRPPTVVYVQQPAAKNQTGNRSISAGWVLLIGGFILACIPLLGFAAWIVGIFLCLAALILAIIGMSHGRTLGGLFLLAAALIGAPITYLAAPIVSTAVFGKAMEKHAPKDAKMPSGDGWVPGPAAR